MKWLLFLGNILFDRINKHNVKGQWFEIISNVKNCGKIWDIFQIAFPVRWCEEIGGNAMKSDIESNGSELME